MLICFVFSKYSSDFFWILLYLKLQYSFFLGLDFRYFLYMAIEINFKAFSNEWLNLSSQHSFVFPKKYLVLYNQYFTLSTYYFPGNHHCFEVNFSFSIFPEVKSYDYE